MDTSAGLLRIVRMLLVLLFMPNFPEGTHSLPCRGQRSNLGTASRGPLVSGYDRIRHLDTESTQAFCQYVPRIRFSEESLARDW